MIPYVKLTDVEVGKPEFRVIITGSRDWADEDAIKDVLGFLWDLNGMVTVVHGDCPTGADFMARQLCRRMNSGDQGEVIKEERHPAKWDLYKKTAGFVRNAHMAGLGADLCVAFNRDESKGTSMMEALAHKRGIPVVRYTA